MKTTSIATLTIALAAVASAAERPSQGAVAEASITPRSIVTVYTTVTGLMNGKEKEVQVKPEYEKEKGSGEKPVSDVEREKAENDRRNLETKNPSPISSGKTTVIDIDQAEEEAEEAEQEAEEAEEEAEHEAEEAEHEAEETEQETEEQAEELAAEQEEQEAEAGPVGAQKKAADNKSPVDNKPAQPEDEKIKEPLADEKDLADELAFGNADAKIKANAASSSAAATGSSSAAATGSSSSAAGASSSASKSASSAASSGSASSHPTSSSGTSAASTTKVAGTMIMTVSAFVAYYLL